MQNAVRPVQSPRRYLPRSSPRMSGYISRSCRAFGSIDAPSVPNGLRPEDSRASRTAAGWLSLDGWADASELPVAAERRRDDFLGLARLGPDVLADRHVALDDAVPQGAEALDLDLHDIAGLDRPRVGRRPRQDDVAWHERDGPGDVGNQVVHVPYHLVGVPVLLHLAVDQGADPLGVEVPVGHQSWSERAERVGALHPEHGTGIGIAEVVEPEVVPDRVSGDVLAGLIGSDMAA